MRDGLYIKDKEAYYSYCMLIMALNGDLLL